MKKILITVVLVLLLVVCISPGLVGKFAENALNEQLDWAATSASSGELDVRLESYESHWFTSSSVRYIRLGDGNIRKTMMDAGQLLDPDSLPKLRVDTVIDHGLIPISSIRREGGSLAPALGSAMSVMTIERYEAEPISVPGKVFSKLGLAGGFDSEYVLPAGSYGVDGEELVWQDGRARIKASRSTGRIQSDGNFAGLTVKGDGDAVEIGELAFEIDTRPGDSGLYIGDFNMRVESVRVDGPSSMSFGPITIASVTREDGDRVNSDFNMDLLSTAPMLGDMAFELKMSLLDADAVALKGLSDTANSLDDAIPPAAIYSMLEDDLIQLVAAGFTIDIKQLDLQLPQGLVDADLKVVVPTSDATSFSWASVMQSASGKASLNVPGVIVQLAAMASPQINMLISMGLLQENGELYTMSALYEKGLLTINGSPIPLPMPRT